MVRLGCDEGNLDEMPDCGDCQVVSSIAAMPILIA